MYVMVGEDVKNIRSPMKVPKISIDVIIVIMNMYVTNIYTIFIEI